MIAGHENAALGGINKLEGRDYMVEQMIPVDFWDTTGYVSIPLKDSQPSDPQTYEGTGENYRTYTWDSLGSKIDFYDQCIGVPVDMSAHRLAQPPSERSGVSCPVNFEATNGKKFSVMMYDLRNFASAAPYPAPSMMTIIPVSSWKTSFMWYVPANKFETLQAYDLNVIAPSTDFDNGIKASYNGGPLKSIKAVLSLEQQFKIIPGHPGYSGVRFKLYPGSYYATGPNPFIVYNFGFRALDADGDLGDFDGDDFFFSYANPAGASLSSGDPGNFKVTVDTFCGKWHVCVHDGRKINAGIRSVSLLNDSLATQFTPGKQSSNCHFDPSFDPANFGEVELPGTDSVVCFNVEVNFPIDSAYAAIRITDNAGNLQLVELRYSPIKFSITPSSYPITFGNMKIGTDSCLFVRVKNTAAVPQMILSANLASGIRFNLTLVSSTLPIQLAAGDSVIMKLCFSASDTAFVKDTLNLALSCLTIPIELTGRGAIGLIYADDYNAGQVIVGRNASRLLIVKNIGTKPFTLTNNWTMTGSNAFSFTTIPVLPTVIQPTGQPVAVQVNYVPTAIGKDTAIIHWNTDIEAPYTQSVKSYSILTGEGVTGSSSVKELPQKLALSIRPNPANGNSIFISFTQAEEENFEVQIFDVLGRELYKRTIIGSNTAEIPIRNLQNGIYYARITCGAKIVSEKFEVVR